MILHLTIQSINHHALLYIGPGMGGGLISLVIAFLVSFFTFLIAIIWYPIKKTINFIKRIGSKTAPKNDGAVSSGDYNSSKENV